MTAIFMAPIYAASMFLIWYILYKRYTTTEHLTFGQIVLGLLMLAVSATPVTNSLLLLVLWFRRERTIRELFSH